MIWKSFRTSQLEYIITLGCLLIAVHNGLAAPVYDSTEIDTADSNSCYYNYNHYYEGDRILTNEPCLNCTCHNRMLMCYLRVCPFTKPIGQDCVVERREDQCCPIITCPEVPVEINHQTTSNPITALGGLEKYGCSIEGEFYPEGAQVPSNPRKPCELCYCIRNMTACVMQECTLHVDGCQPIYNKGVCCPVRYDCEHDQDSGLLMIDTETTTTERPTPGFMITTTVVPGAITECIHDTDLYSDGEMINTDDPCEYCYCMKGDIVCAVTECGTPLENRGKNCTAKPRKPGQCCPDKYECEMPGNATISDTMDRTTEKTEATTFEPETPTKQIDLDDSRPTTFAPDSMITDSGVDEEPTPREDVQIPSRVGDETDEDKDQKGALRTTTASEIVDDKEPFATTLPSYIDDQNKIDSATTLASVEPEEITTHDGMDELTDDKKTPVPSTDIKEPVTEYEEPTPIVTVMPTEKDIVEPIDSTTAKYSEPKPSEDVTTEINDQFGPDEGTTQKIYDVPTPDLSDHELQQHIDDDEVFTKKPQQSDDEDKEIDMTTRLYTDIGTTLSPQVSDDDKTMDSEEDNTVKPYDSTTIEGKDKYPTDEITTPASSSVPTSQPDSGDENITDSKLKVTSEKDDDDSNVTAATAQPAIEDATSHDDMTDDDSKTLKPLFETEVTTAAHVISTENKTFKMEDEMQTEKYDGLFASFVPGEGSCLLNGVTYANNSIMPPIDVCQLSCTCINSNIICDNSRCDTSPQQGVLCDAADGKCGEDLITPTEGSAQGPVDSSLDGGDLMAPHEGSAQGEVPCADDKCDGSPLIRPAQSEIPCADGKCDGSEPVTPVTDGDASDLVTPTQDKMLCAGGKCDESKPIVPDTIESETPVDVGLESTTLSQDKLPCANGECDGLDLTTPTKDEETDSATEYVAKPIPDISIPIRIDVPESTSSPDGEVACADGKCDDLQTPAPGFVPEISTLAQGDLPETPTSTQGEITCTDGKCDDSVSQTTTPGLVSDMSTPAQGDALEVTTSAQGVEITCTDEKCDGLELATPAQEDESKLPIEDTVSEIATPVKSDGSESTTETQDKTACVGGQCDLSETTTAAQGVEAELTISGQPKLSCTNGKCDGSEPITPVQGELPCDGDKCDETKPQQPAQDDETESTTATQSDGSQSATSPQVDESESATKPQDDVLCIDGKCEDSQPAAPTPTDGSLVTPAKSDEFELSTPAIVDKPEYSTPSQESSTPVQSDDSDLTTPGAIEFACLDGKCDGSESATPAQVDVSQSTLPAKDVESETATPSQDKISCANGKCDESAKPLEGELPCADGKCDGSATETPTQVDITCADGKCDEEIVQPPKTITPQEGGIACGNTPEGRCDIPQQVVPDQETSTDSDVYTTTPAQKIPPLDTIACTGGLCDNEILLQGVPDQTPISCSGDNCDESVTSLQGEDLVSPTQLTPTQDEKCISGSCLDDLIKTLNQTTEPVSVIQVVTVLPEMQTDLPESTDRTPDLSRPTSTEQTDQQKTTQSGQDDDEEQTDKDTIITRIQVLPTTTESASEVDKVTDIVDKYEPSEQPDSQTEQNATEKDVTVPAEPSPTEESEIGHKTDVSKPSSQTPEEVKPIETSTMSDKDVSDMITSLPVDDTSKTQFQPTEVLPIEKDISEPDTTDKFPETASPTTVISDIPVSDITARPSDSDDDLEIDSILKTTMKPISLDEDVSEPILPIAIDDLSDKTETPVVEVKQPTTSATVEKVTDSSEEDQDSTTVQSEDKKPILIEIKPEVSQTPSDETPSVTTASTPEKVQPTDVSEDKEASTKTPETPVIKETALPTETPKIDELSTSVEDVPLPTVIAPIHGEEPQNQMGVTDKEGFEVTTSPASDTTETSSKTSKPETDKSESELEATTPEAAITTVQALPEQKPSVTEKTDYQPSTDESIATTMPTKVIPSAPEVPSRIDSDDNEIVSTTSSKDEQMDITTQTSPAVPVRVDSDKPSEIDSGDNETDATTPSADDKATTSVKDEIGDVDDTTVPERDEVTDKTATITETTPSKSGLDSDATTPSQDADKPSGVEETTPIKMETIKPSSMDDDQTTSQYTTDKSTSGYDGETTTRKDSTEKLTPFDDDIKEADIITAAPIEDGTIKPSQMDDQETTPSKDVTDQPISIYGDETTPTTPKEAAAKPSSMEPSESTTTAEDTDKSSSLDDTETTPSQDYTDKMPSKEVTETPSILDDTETTPSKDTTDKSSPLDETETTPSKATTVKPSPLDDTETTPSRDKYDEDKESDIITVGPIVAATDKTSSLDDSETTTVKEDKVKSDTIDKEDEDADIITASPIDDDTTKPSPVDRDETTPSQQVSDTPSRIDSEVTVPSVDATDKPSPIESEETTPSEEVTDKTQLTDVSETTPGSAATEKTVSIDKEDATDMPSPVDNETTPSQDVTAKPDSLNEEQTPTSKYPTEKPSSIDVSQTTPGQEDTEKTTPLDASDKESEIITAKPTDDGTDIPSLVDDDDTTPSHDIADKPAPVAEDQTTLSQGITDQPSLMEEDQTSPSKDATEKISPFDDDEKESDIITARPEDSVTDKVDQIYEQEVTGKPSAMDDDQTKPSKETSETSTPTDDDKQPEIITTGPTDDTTDKLISIDVGPTESSIDATEKPISSDDEQKPEISTSAPSADVSTETRSPLDDDKTPAGQEATDAPIMDVTTTPSKEATEKTVAFDDADKEIDVTTTPSKEISAIDDSETDDTTSSQTTPSKVSPDISATTLPSDSDASSDDIDNENKTSPAESETTTAKTIKLSPIDGETTPSEYIPEVTGTPLAIDQLGEITTPSKDATEKTDTIDDMDKDVSATTASAEPMTIKYVTDDTKPIDDMDMKPVTTEPTETSDDKIEDLTEKIRPAFDADEKDMVTATSSAPSDMQTTPVLDVQQSTDKSIQIDDIEKERPVSTTVSPATTQIDEQTMDVATIVSIKLDEEKPVSSTEAVDKDITETTSAPIKKPEELDAKPDKMDTTTSQDDLDIPTEKPSPLDSEKDMPVTIKTIPTTLSDDQDKESTVTEVPSRIDDSDNVTTQRTTPDEALVDELFTKPTEAVKKPQDGYDYQKPPQDKIEYTKQPAETTIKPESQYTQTISHPLFTTQAPAIMETPGYGAHLPPQPPQYSGNYPDEEYGEDEDPASFGPGTCRYAGKIYVSAQQIPRDDPCDFCFCFRSDIICLQQSCPPPISGCYEEPISGFCCPRYECHVKMATVLNVTTSTTTTTTTLPPHFMHHAYKGAAKRSGCQIKGQAYQVGEIIPSQSGPCMRCICGGDGQMQCEPKVCSPEPMLQQMIAVAAASRRRR